MSPTGIREPALAPWIALAALASALDGLAVAFAWRYGATRTWIDAVASPPVDSGDFEYFRVYGYVQYASGPSLCDHVGRSGRRGPYRHRRLDQSRVAPSRTNDRPVPIIVAPNRGGNQRRHWRKCFATEGSDPR
ncbi:hypothetical protein [Rhodococcus sp. 077-4]|uniref:hypothetical protein n=1 Tax=Rhodococcus sp. 077-4 TaxID=2789271 RepID=UPI0039F5ED3C